ncbi:MAG: phosphoribosylglycinamide formyltransferase [Brevinematales bacterium]|nr:phosphoribosylglycinamide formyltransferase [Brevinematales bacterium]
MEKLKLGILVSGRGSNLEAIIKAIENGELKNVEIAIVLSDNKAARALEICKLHNIKAEYLDPGIYKTKLEGEAEQNYINKLKENNVDLVVLAGFMRVIKQNFINAFRNRIINIHPSLLPKYPGLNTHKRVIEAKEKESGCTVHFVNELVDGGKRIMQAKVKVMENDTPENLAARILQKEHIILPKVIKMFADGKIDYDSFPDKPIILEENIIDSVRRDILLLDFYKAGKVSKKKGKAIKLSSNENLLGTSPLSLKAIKRALNSNLNIYPDSKMTDLKMSIVSFLEKNNIYIKKENIIFGDGSGEVISMIFSLFITEGLTLILPEKSFILYYLQSKCRGARICEVERTDFKIDLNKIFDKVTEINGKKVVLFANPDNPTSTFVSKDDIEKFLRKIPSDIPVIIDEAYIHFAGLNNSVIPLIEKYNNLIIIHTFSKAFGLASLRVGYGIMHEDLIYQIEKIRLPFNLGKLQQIGAINALKDETFLYKTLSFVEKGKILLQKGFKDLGIKYLEPYANFFFVDFGNEAKELISFLNEKGISLRHLVDFGYPENFVRITIGLPIHNKILLKRMKEFYGRKN